MPKHAKTGAEAVAHAMLQMNPDVVAAYPITPQTPIVENYASFVANGLTDTEMIPVESEHSAMSATVGASAAGARAMTATSANGLALMNEIVFIAASLRLPILMPVVNRALSGNINIHNDHSDTMSVRDSGWVQLYAENSQEAYDLSILGLKLAEHKDVQLPVIVALDGFIISHSIEVYESIEDQKVKEFVGEKRETQYALLDVDHPVTVGPLDLFDYYFEHKRSQIEAHKKAYEIFPQIAEQFKKISNREYGYYEGYMLDDADYVIVALGSGAGTIKHVINSMRKDGKKVGLLKITMFRPFPYKEIANVLKNAKKIAVLDKSASFGADSPVFNEIKSALYDTGKNIPVFSYLYGLGGRDFKAEDAEGVFVDLIEGNTSNEMKYIGLRG